MQSLNPVLLISFSLETISNLTANWVVAPQQHFSLPCLHLQNPCEREMGSHDRGSLGAAGKWVGKSQLHRRHILNICKAWFANQHATTLGVTLTTLK